MSQERTENYFSAFGQVSGNDEDDRDAQMGRPTSSPSLARPLKVPRPVPPVLGMPKKCDSISRLAPDRNVPRGYNCQLARMQALLDSAGSSSDDHASLEPPQATHEKRSWSRMLAALDVADPTAPHSSSAPSSPSSSAWHRHPTSRSYQRRHFTDPPTTTFPGFAQSTVTNSTSLPSSTHPLYYLANEPEKILDAPGTSDDYYARRLDWSSRNLVSVGLGHDAYLWNPDSGESMLLPPVSNSNAASRVTALTFTPAGEHLTVGIDAGVVAHFDIATQTRVRSGKPTFPLSEYQDVACAKLSELGVAVTRTTCMVYVSATVLLTGDATGRILLWDMRTPLATVPATLRRVHAPGNPVCGLAANDDGITFASGGNDGIVCVWDARRVDKPVVTWKEAHVGAVRALAWCPLRANVLATGGGTADARIKYRDTLTRRSIARIETGGQVTALRFLRHAHSTTSASFNMLMPHEPVLLSAAGYRSTALAAVGGSPPPRLTAWQAGSRVWSQDGAHSDLRVLDLSVSPREDFMATLGADESLHVWRMRSVNDMEQRTGLGEGEQAGVKRVKSFSCAALRKASGVGVAARLAEVVAEQAGVEVRELLSKKVVSYSPYRRPAMR